MKMHYIISFLFCFLLPADSAATTQAQDTLTVNNESLGIAEQPLRSYENFDDVVTLLNPENRMRCSANKRGYIARWELKNKKLFLKAIVNNPCQLFQIWIEEKREPTKQDISNITVDPRSIFGAPYPVAAVWYSGTLNVYEPTQKTKVLEESDDFLEGKFEYVATSYQFVKGNLKAQSSKKATFPFPK